MHVANGRVMPRLLLLQGVGNLSLSPRFAVKQRFCTFARIGIGHKRSVSHGCADYLDNALPR